MRVLRKHYKQYSIAMILCFVLSGLVAVTNGAPTYAKSIPESLVDLLTGRKDAPTNTNTNKSPENSVVPTPSQSPVALQPAPVSTSSPTPATTKAKAANANVASVTGTTASIPKSADTSQQVVQLATAQATRTTAASHYTSSKIADSERDDIYKASIVVTSIGAITYLLSYTKPWQWFYRNAVASHKTVTQ